MKIYLALVLGLALVLVIGKLASKDASAQVYTCNGGQIRCCYDCPGGNCDALYPCPGEGNHPACIPSCPVDYWSCGVEACNVDCTPTLTWDCGTCSIGDGKFLICDNCGGVDCRPPCKTCNAANECITNYNPPACWPDGNECDINADCGPGSPTSTPVPPTPPVPRSPVCRFSTGSGTRTVCRGDTEVYSTQSGTCYDPDGTIVSVAMMYSNASSWPPAFTELTPRCGSANCTKQKQWTGAGTFYMALMAWDNYYNFCSSNPWCEWEPNDPPPTYYANCAASQSDCNSSALDWARVSVINIPPISGFSLTSVCSPTPQANLDWADDTTVCNSQYRVYRCTDTTGAGCLPSTQIATVGGSSYIDADPALVPGTRYCYRVRGENGGLVGSLSTTLCTTIPPLLAPTLTYAASCTQVDLDWNNSQCASSWEVRKCTGSGCLPSTLIATPAVSEHADTDIIIDSTYGYRVRGKTGALYSPYSNTVYATIPNVPAPANLTTSQSCPSNDPTISLSWGAAACGTEAADSYNIYRCGPVTLGTTCNPDNTTAWRNVTTTSEVDNTVSALRTYCYEVSACVAGVCGAPTTAVCDGVPEPVAPEAPTVTVSNCSGECSTTAPDVQVSWNDVSCRSSYRILRCQDGDETPDCAPALYQTVTPSTVCSGGTCTYTDTGLANDAWYRYSIRSMMDPITGPVSTISDIQPHCPSCCVEQDAVELSLGTTVPHLATVTTTDTYQGILYTLPISQNVARICAPGDIPCLLFSVPKGSADSTLIDVFGLRLGSTNITARATVTGGGFTATCSDVDPVNVFASGWFQTWLGDVISGGALTSRLPANRYLIESNISSGLYPGIGLRNGGSDLGAGAISIMNWYANTPAYMDTYDYQHYEDKLTTGIFDPNIGSTITEFTGGDLYGSHEWYFYQHDEAFGNEPVVTIANDIDLGGRKIILFVKNADLNIQGTVTNGFIMPIVEGTITVDPVVGGGTDPHLEGVFVSNRFETPNGAPGVVDLTLRIRGTVNANEISFGRDLIDLNQTTPAEYVEYAPEFMFMVPTTLSEGGIRWKEVAP